MKPQTDPAARHEAGARLAERLVGADREDAKAQIAEAGFDCEVVGPDVHAVTADHRFNRIRLYVDANHRVLRAEAG